MGSSKRKRRAKVVSLKEGEDALENLVALNYEVIQFSRVHFRINGRLNVWPSTRKYHDINTGRIGTYDPGNLEEFVKSQLKPYFRPAL